MCLVCLVRVHMPQVSVWTPLPCLGYRLTMFNKRVYFFLPLFLMAVTSLPATVLVGKKEVQCFYQYAERKTKFRATVFVFHGGSRDIGFSVSCLDKHYAKVQPRVLY